MNLPNAINCGRFLQFVYDFWNTSGNTTNLDGHVVTFKGAPVVSGKTYTVLKTIYSNDLATDISKLSPNTFVTIGIVAQSADDPADIVIAIRGTANVWEWIQDAKFLPRPFPPVTGSGLTEDGFTDMYLSFSLTPSAATGFMAAVKNIIPSNAMVTVTGHSLGASLATLFALDASVNTTFPVTVYTLASPRVGDLVFHNLFNHVVPNAYRIDNRLDLVPHLPPAVLYFHVGDETELIPGPDLKFTVACEHELSTYLHLLATLSGQAAQYALDSACSNTPAIAAVANGRADV